MNRLDDTVEQIDLFGEELLLGPEQIEQKKYALRPYDRESEVPGEKMPEAHVMAMAMRISEQPEKIADLNADSEGARAAKPKVERHFVQDYLLPIIAERDLQALSSLDRLADIHVREILREKTVEQVKAVAATPAKEDLETAVSEMTDMIKFAESVGLMTEEWDTKYHEEFGAYLKAKAYETADTISDRLTFAPIDFDFQNKLPAMMTLLDLYEELEDRAIETEEGFDIDSPATSMGLALVSYANVIAGHPNVELGSRLNKEALLLANEFYVIGDANDDERECISKQLFAKGNYKESADVLDDPKTEGRWSDELFWKVGTQYLAGNTDPDTLEHVGTKMGIEHDIISSYVKMKQGDLLKVSDMFAQRIEQGGERQDQYLFARKTLKGLVLDTFDANPELTATELMGIADRHGFRKEALSQAYDKAVSDGRTLERWEEALQFAKELGKEQEVYDGAFRLVDVNSDGERLSRIEVLANRLGEDYGNKGRARLGRNMVEADRIDEAIAYMEQAGDHSETVRSRLWEVMQEKKDQEVIDISTKMREPANGYRLLAQRWDLRADEREEFSQKADALALAMDYAKNAKQGDAPNSMEENTELLESLFGKALNSYVEGEATPDTSSKIRELAKNVDITALAAATHHTIAKFAQQEQVPSAVDYIRNNLADLTPAMVQESDGLEGDLWQILEFAEDPLVEQVGNAIQQEHMAHYLIANRDLRDDSNWTIQDRAESYALMHKILDHALCSEETQEGLVPHEPHLKSLAEIAKISYESRPATREENDELAKLSSRLAKVNPEYHADATKNMLNRMIEEEQWQEGTRLVIQYAPEQEGRLKRHMYDCFMNQVGPLAGEDGEHLLRSCYGILGSERQAHETIFTRQFVSPEEASKMPYREVPQPQEPQQQYEEAPQDKHYEETPQAEASGLEGKTTETATFAKLSDMLPNGSASGTIGGED